MGKYKKTPRYNVLSMRVSDDEKATMDEISRYTQKSISMLMREALNYYTPNMSVTISQGDWRV